MTIIVFALCIFFLIGLYAGIQIQTRNIIKIGEAIQIEELNIDLNESKMTEAIMIFAEERGYIEAIQKQAEQEEEEKYFPEWKDEKKEPLVLIK